MHDKYEAVVIWGSGLLSKNKAFLPSSDLKLVYMIASWLDMTTGGQRLFPIVSFLSSSLCEKSTYGMYVEGCLCLGLKTVFFFLPKSQYFKLSEQLEMRAWGKEMCNAVLLIKNC